MIKFKTLSFRNFLSYGNNTTLVQLDRVGTTLIQGRNLDDTTEGVTSNGVGKTVIINALSYVLYDKPVSDISKDKLVNHINNKQMEVTVDFEKDNKHYRIVRARKMKSGADGNYVIIEENGKDITPAGRESNEVIEQIIGMPHDLFVRIVVFSATNKSFLSLPTKSTTGVSQAGMVEHLFGLTMISEKAKVLSKTHIKNTEQSIEIEQIKIEQQEKEQTRHEEQIKTAKERIEKWDVHNKAELSSTITRLNELEKIDIESEKDAFNIVSSLNETISKDKLVIKELEAELLAYHKTLEQIESTEKKSDQWAFDNALLIEGTTKKLESLSRIDISSHKKAFEDLSQLTNASTDFSRKKDLITTEIKKLVDEVAKKEKELAHLKDEKCPYCLQNFKDAQLKINEIDQFLISNNEAQKRKNLELSEFVKKLEECSSNIDSIKNQLEVKTEKELLSIEKDIETYKNKIKDLLSATNPYITTLTELEQSKSLSDDELDSIEKLIEAKRSSIDKMDREVKRVKEKLSFSSLDEIMKAETQIEITKQKKTDLEQATNPYVEPYEELLSAKLDIVDYTKINTLKKKLDHQQFLLKLLTKKDSFVRKTLLQKNLPLLNNRLQFYVGEMRLPHRVEFTNELVAKISHFGRELDFGNLSNGQQARVNLAISLAFRDILEQLHTHINVCMFDEVLDAGLDSVGVQLAAHVLKKKAQEEQLCLYIITHRDEIENKFDNNLMIEMENSFSNIRYV